METSKLVERQACSITYIGLKNIIQYRLSANLIWMHIYSIQLCIVVKDLCWKISLSLTSCDRPNLSLHIFLSKL